MNSAPVELHPEQVVCRHPQEAGEPGQQNQKSGSDQLHWARWDSFLSERVDSAGISVFRAAFGVSVAYFAWKTMAQSIIVADFIQPKFHLTYFGFEWVKPWSADGMYLLFVSMFLGGIGVALGVYYRLSALIVLYTFTHAFLIERTQYNNHYYLIVLLALLVNVIPMHHGWSVDAARHPGRFPQTLPLWTAWLVRFQVGIVYFFGGIVKLDADWLRGQPMGMWLRDQSELPVIGPFLGLSFMPMLFSSSGLLIDLLAVPLLCWKPTRIIMYAVLLTFHLLNSLLFTIGLFPWLMMVETLIFFPPDWPRKLFGIPNAVPEKHSSSEKNSESGGKGVVPSCWSLRRRVGVGFLAMYVAVQLLVPLRHFLVSGNPSWTEYGQLFAWRMMLRQKLTGMRFFATDVTTGETREIDIRKYLTQRQAIQMSRDPDLIADFAGLLAEDFCRQGKPKMEIRAKILASLNGRKPQLLIDPAIDLAQVSRSIFPQPWIMPLIEPFRSEPWYYPLAEWEERLNSSEEQNSTPLSSTGEKSSSGMGEEIESP